MKAQKVLTTVLFDMDGTLLDSREFYLSSFRQMIRDHLGFEISMEKALACFGMAGNDFVRQFVPEDQVTKFVELWNDYLDRSFDKLCLYPGIRSSLETLKAAGMKIGVVTAQVEYVNRKARQVINIEDLIDAWVVDYEAGAAKPDPAPVQLALRKLQAQPDEAIMVGDSSYDMEAGKRAGLQVGAVLWGASHPEALRAYQPERYFQDPKELTELIPTDSNRPGFCYNPTF